MMRKPFAMFKKIAQDSKSLSQQGLKASVQLFDLLQQSRQKGTPQGQVIDAIAVERCASKLEYQDVKQLFQHQLPSLTRQVLGSRYQAAYKVAQMLLPNGFEKLLDQALHSLVASAQRLGATERVLEQMGEHQLQVLAQDLARSQRASQAFKWQNQVLAELQGAISGASGVFGAAVDLPASVLLALKTIYEIGHVYGFELDNEEDQAAVFAILSQADLSLIAEKQSILFMLRSLQAMLQSGDYQQIDAFLNSQHSLDAWQDLLKDQQGQYKAGVTHALSVLSKLRYLSPICAAGVGAYYSHQWIAQVSAQAEQMFATARHYLQNNQQQNLSILAAYAQQLASNGLPQPEHNVHAYDEQAS